MRHPAFRPLQRRSDTDDPLLQVGLPDRSVLARLFIYDPSENALYWKRRTPDLCMTESSLRSFNMTYAGTRAGTTNGYVVIFGRAYKQADVIEKIRSDK